MDLLGNTMELVLWLQNEGNIELTPKKTCYVTLYSPPQLTLGVTGLIDPTKYFLRLAVTIFYEIFARNLIHKENFSP